MPSGSGGLLPLLLRLLFCLLCLPALPLAAFVQPFPCGSQAGDFFGLQRAGAAGLLSNLVTEVMITSDELMIYRLQFTAQEPLEDLNSTLNQYSTVETSTNFISGSVCSQAVRMCNHLTRLSSNSTFPVAGVPLATIAELIEDTNFDDDIWVPVIDSNSTILDPDTNNACPLTVGARYQIIFVSQVEKHRYFGSYDTQFHFISADSSPAVPNDECFEVFVTPFHPPFITYPICFGIMAVFVLGLLATFYIYHSSPNQESSNAFLLIASSICNEPLLNELTPDAMSLLHYLQFSLFAVCLNLGYPWFLPVILSFTNWVALIRVDIFSSTFINPLSSDGAYQTLGRYGLFAIFPVAVRQPTGQTLTQIWGNFMIWITCCIAFFTILSHCVVYFHNRKPMKWKNVLSQTLGIFVQFYYQYFPLPFAAISSFLIWGLCTNQRELDIASAVFGIIFFLLWLVVLLWFFFKNVWKSNKKLYTSFNIIAIWSPVYNYYKPQLVWFFLVDKLKIFADGMIIGFGPQNGVVQLAFLLLLNVIYLFAVVFYQPFFNRRKNVWTIGLVIIQTVNMMLSIAFIQDLEVRVSVRSIVADVQLLIHALVILTFLAFFILRSTQVYLRCQKSKKQQWSPVRTGDPDVSATSFDTKEVESSTPQHITNYDDIMESRDDESLDSVQLRLTDSRVLPGLSLNYLDDDSDEDRRPTKISPITYEYLENIIEKEDSEVKALWQNRLKKRKTRKLEDVPEEKGFSVVGRKPITVQKPPSTPKRAFEVVGRKDIKVAK